jgi:cytochrome d ubiquinol oxidase subunit II
LLIIFYGAALANVIRGVPLGTDSYFFLPLWTNWRVGPNPGILDWYTVLAGVFSLVALAGHGAAFLAWRTGGPVGERSRRLGVALHGALALLWPLATLATHAVNPTLLPALPGRPLAWASIALAAGGLAWALRAGVRGRGLASFLGSCAFLTGMLGATAACMFPVLLRALPDASRSITVFDGGATAHGLRVALGWWSIGFPIAAIYFTTLFHLHRARAAPPPEGAGY